MKCQQSMPTACPTLTVANATCVLFSKPSTSNGAALFGAAPSKSAAPPRLVQRALPIPMRATQQPPPCTSPSRPMATTSLTLMAPSMPRSPMPSTSPPPKSSATTAAAPATSACNAHLPRASAPSSTSPASSKAREHAPTAAAQAAAPDRHRAANARRSAPSALVPTPPPAAAHLLNLLDTAPRASPWREKMMSTSRSNALKRRRKTATSYLRRRPGTNQPASSPRCPSPSPTTITSRTSSYLPVPSSPPPPVSPPNPKESSPRPSPGFSPASPSCSRNSLTSSRPAEREFYFTLGNTADEVGSALHTYVKSNNHRLKDGRVWAWHTDNGREFTGDRIDGEHGAARELVHERTFSIPHVSNSNAIAERSFGVLERGVRCCLAYANADDCLWPWAAHQCQQVNQFLATTTHDPPQSPHDFTHPGSEAADLSWAHVLFCDVTVPLHESDLLSKVSPRTAQGCHLGYDAARRGHYVYVPSLKRISTYRVSSWCGETSFTIAPTIAADTPVQYHDMHDLPSGEGQRLPRVRHARAAMIGSAEEGGPPPPPQTPPRDACWRLEQPQGADALAAVEHACLSRAKGSLAWAAHLDSEPLAVALAAVAPASSNLPTTVAEARKSKYWDLVKEAMESEIKGKFIENKAWKVVPRTPGMNVIKSKWVLKFTQRPDGSIEKVKARLVACGYGQKEGIDYSEVFAATLPALSLRTLLAIIAAEDLNTDKIDAYKAFTQEYVDAVIHVEMPDGFTVKGHVLSLDKALEGIKQGAYLWFGKNKRVLLSLGFNSSPTEPNLYVHQDGRILVGVFADDILVGYHRSCALLYEKIKKEYAEQIKVADTTIKEVTEFIGIEIARDRAAGTLTISQPGYLTKLYGAYQASLGKEEQLAGIPYGARSIRENFDKLKPADENDRVDTSEYLRACGALVWPASMTRPDIQYAVSVLCSFAQCAGRAHLDAAVNAIGYLYKTRALGITYGGKLQTPPGLLELPPHFIESNGLHAYHDSSWGKTPYAGGLCRDVYGRRTHLESLQAQARRRQLR
mmetsp:Transcript_2194/g.7161  ORF Transcript_2194/g.7161 Transcript_2194/m.7161 type:complete len:1030 (+) Transcript_2194:1510-4599(+)